MFLGIANAISGIKSGGLSFIKDNLKLYLDFKSNKSDTLKFPSEGSTSFVKSSSQYISLGDSDSLSFGDSSSDTPFSVTAWINANDITSLPILAKGTASVREYIFGFSSLDKLSFGCHDNSNASISINRTGTTTLTSFEGSWIHVAGTYDGSGVNSGIKLYINGASESTTDGSNGTYTAMHNLGEAVIGRTFSDGTNYADGKMANVAIWNRELTPEEIQSIMNKSYSQLKGVEKTSLVSWWGLDSATTGSNLIADSGFDDASYWSAGSGWSVNGTTASKAVGADTWSVLQRSSLLKGGVTYRFTADVRRLSGIGLFRFYAQSNFGANIYPYAVNGDNLATYTQDLVSNADNGNPAIRIGGSALSIEVDNFTVQELNIHKDSHGSNDGSNVGATINSNVYGGNAPILPRAVDVAKEGQADAIGDGSLTTSSGGYADLGNDSLIQFGGSFSVSCWFKTTDTTTTNEMVIAKADDGVSAGWLIRLNSSRKLDFSYLHNASGGSGVVISDTGSAVNDGEWYHVAFVHESGVGNRAYKNGILIGSNSTGTDLGSHTPNLHVGNQDYVTARALDGSFAQVGLWQGALTQAQVQSVMESTSYSKIPADVKSTLGSELITNGTFDSDISGWSNYVSSRGDILYSNGRLRIDNTTGDGFTVAQISASFSSGKTYKVSFDYYHISGSTTSGINILLGASDQIVPSITSGQTTTAYITASANRSTFEIGYNGGDVYELDNISVKEVINDIVAYYPLDGSSEVKGLSFTTDDYIQLPVPFSYTNHSISVWAKHGTTGSAIFDARDSSSDGARIGIDSSGRLQYKVNGSNALVATAYTNQWVHYFCTYDGSTMRVYVNGVQAKTNGTSQTIDTTTNARIGRNSYSSGYFDGSISSLALYSVTKSADEALAIYNDGIGGDESSNSGLVGYWKLDNATTVTDLSGNGNNGTVTGATLISAGTTDSVGNNDGGLY